MRASFLALTAAVAMLFLTAPAQAQWQPGYSSGSFRGGAPYCAVEFQGRLVVGGDFLGAGCVNSRSVIATDFEDYYPVVGVLSFGSVPAKPRVSALVVYDGQLVAAGEFTGAQYQGHVNIARHTGSNWASLGATPGDGALNGGVVYDLVVFEGDLIAVGDFKYADPGNDLDGIARWDGSSWHAMGARPVGAQALAVYEGQLYCGLSRWDGSQWVSYGTVGPLGSAITALDVVDEGLAIGGSFETIDGQVYKGTALIEATELRGFGNGAWTDALPTSGLTTPDFPGVGGFASFEGETYMLTPRMELTTYWQYFMISRLDTSEGWDHWRGITDISSPYMGQLPGGALVVMGDRMVALTAWWRETMDALGAPRRYDMVLRDGKWSGLVSGRGSVDRPRAVAAGAGGYWLAVKDGGLVIQTNETTRLVGRSVLYRDVEPTPLGVFAIGEVQPGGDADGGYPLFIEMTSADPLVQELGYIASIFEPELLTAGLAWRGGYLLAVESNYTGIFGTGIGFADEETLHGGYFLTSVELDNVDVSAMALHVDQPWFAIDGQLYRIDGDPETGISGTLVATFNGPVHALTSDGTRLLVGGDFDSLNAQPVHNLAAWDGTAWSQPFAVSGPIYSMVTDTDAVTFVGGAFWQFGGQTSHYMAAFRDDDVGVFPDGPNGPVTDLALTDRGFIAIGDFDSAGGYCSNHVAEWWGTGNSVAIEDLPGDGHTSRITELRILAPNPNPFNPRVTLAFELPRAAHVQLSVYDVAGRLVQTVVSGDRGPGRHEFNWDGLDAAGRAVSSGVYLAVLESDGRRETTKMALVR